ncbi:MAG: DUF1573 domain-containing protein [Deltaproteobacteria bacterium]|nr:DUF1573 domain-containing protein [Deltaproteobacteria bacterium]
MIILSKKYLVALFLIFTWCWAGYLGAAGPQLKVLEPTFDFGEVAEGETVSHEFIIQNTGTEGLQINDVRPG